MKKCQDIYQTDRLVYYCYLKYKYQKTFTGNDRGQQSSRPDDDIPTSCSKPLLRDEYFLYESR